MKKILSMLLAFVLVLALAVPSMAETKGSDAITADKNDPASDLREQGIWDFETDPFELGFTTYDADGDGNNWIWDYGYQPTHVQHKHYEGLGCAVSHSYNYSMGGPLTPDNWLITPEFVCAGFITFWYNPLSSAYCDDLVGIYVTTDDGATWSLEIGSVIGNADIGNVPHEYTMDLSAYEGQSIKVGFRHYNVEDQYAAMLDYITYAPASNQHTITWVVEGQPDITTVVEDGETPVYPNDTPAREKEEHCFYEFAGWTPEIVPATEDATYTATWNAIPYGSVTYLVNGVQIAKLEEVTEMTEDMVPEGIAWYGFVFKSWDKTVEEINAEITQGKDVVVNGVMEVMVTNIHVTTIYGDEFVEKDYTESRWLTVTAKPTNSEGQFFQFWTIDDVIISYSPKATVRIVASCTLEAHYGAEQIEATGVAQLLKADYDNLNKREIFVAYMAAPDGATITGAGLYAASGAYYDPAAGELTSANAQYVKNVKLGDATKPCSYTWYKSSVDEGDVWYVRAFVNYELDGENYSVLGETVAVTAGENYVAGN